MESAKQRHNCGCVPCARIRATDGRVGRSVCRGGWGVKTEVESARRPPSTALQPTRPALPALNMLRPHSTSRRHGSDVKVGVADGAPICWDY